MHVKVIDRREEKTPGIDHLAPGTVFRFAGGELYYLLIGQCPLTGETTAFSLTDRILVNGSLFEGAKIVAIPQDALTLVIER